MHANNSSITFHFNYFIRALKHYLACHVLSPVQLLAIYLFVKYCTEEELLFSSSPCVNQGRAPQRHNILCFTATKPGSLGYFWTLKPMLMSILMIGSSYNRPVMPVIPLSSTSLTMLVCWTFPSTCSSYQFFSACFPHFEAEKTLKTKHR